MIWVRTRIWSIEMDAINYARGACSKREKSLRQRSVTMDSSMLRKCFLNEIYEKKNNENELVLANVIQMVFSFVVDGLSLSVVFGIHSIPNSY